MCPLFSCDTYPSITWHVCAYTAGSWTLFFILSTLCNSRQGTSSTRLCAMARSSRLQPRRNGFAADPEQGMIEPLPSFQTLCRGRFELRTYQYRDPHLHSDPHNVVLMIPCDDAPVRPLACLLVGVGHFWPGHNNRGQCKPPTLRMAAATPQSGL